MKKILFITLLLISFKAFSGDGLTNYTLKFQVKGLKDTVCYLGFCLGENKFVRDTARINSKGEAVFTGKDTLKGGVYLFVLPNMTYFEFLISETEQNFTIITDTSKNLYANMTVTGSPENELWKQYLNTTNKYQQQIEELKKVRTPLDTGSVEYKKLTKDIEKIGEEINVYRLGLIEKNQGTFFAKLINAIREVEVPEAPKEMDEKAARDFRFNYYKDHYFDYLDLSDHRLLRTPILEGKLKYYMENVLKLAPDSLIVEAEKLIARAGSDEEMKRYVIQQLTYFYVNSKVMCVDKVFVYLYDKYFAGSDAGKYLGEESNKKLADQANRVRNVLCGSVFTDIILQDTTEKVWHSLYALNTDYTVVYFFDTDCGHCKKSTPQLDSLNDAYLKPNGIGIYGIEVNLETTDWKKFLIEKKIKFLTVSDNPELNKNAWKYIQEGKTTYESLNFRKTFDHPSYPVIYILDKDKKIIAKKIGVEQIKDFIEEYKRIQQGLSAKPKKILGSD